MSPDLPPETRTERDALGDVQVPVDALWAAQTQRAIENFPVSGRPMPAPVVAAVLHLKAAAAVANAELGALPRDVADAVVDAVDEALQEHLERQFPVDVFQTGSGTSTNMNVNEVVAELAGRRLGRRVHPNDEVNASQSSNDVIPTAIRAATLAAVRRELLPALEVLARSLRDAQERFADVVKAGRTHLMDAVPVTLGQEFGGYATAVELGADRVGATLERLAAMPLGGTATGTGLNAPTGFAARALEVASERLGVELHEAPDHFEAQGAQDVLVEVSGALRTVAVSLNKVATDLRWMGSGPTTGLGELRLPSLQPGSSIMPGKVNPVIPEAVHQVVAQVVGNDAAVAFAGASGAFELNVMLPVMGRNVVESVQLLTNVSLLLAERCVDGLAADEATCRRHAESSPAIVTALAPVVGYDAAAAVAKRAVAEGRTIIDVVLEEGLVDEATARRALDVLAMTRGGLLGD